MISLLVVAAGASALLWALSAYYQYRRAMDQIGWLAGPRTFFSARALLSRFLPDIPYINRKGDWPWKLKYDRTFKEYGADMMSSATFWPQVTVMFFTADPHIIKQVATRHNAFPKPLKIFKMLSIFGSNILATEGDEWRRHRKVVARSFGESNHRLVWEETMKIVLELFAYWDRQGNGEEVKVANVRDITRQIAVMVISVAGFGIYSSWEENDIIPARHQMSFRHSITSASELVIHRIVFPNWVLRLYAKGREAKLAYEEMGAYMREMIDMRRTAPGLEEKQDLFSRLINARETEKDGVSVLSDSELMGNIFTFLIAGHETSANAIAFALGLLALHPDTQEIFYQSIRAIIPEGEIPTYEQVSQLTYGSAVFNEALRMYPIALNIPKVSAYDTTFTTTDNSGSPVTVPVPANTALVFSAAGLHYNPKYWENPYEFNPERFLKSDWNRDAFIPFSAGPRSCIGRRFAELEALAVLTLIVSRYRIEITDEPQYVGETFEQRKERVLKATVAAFTLVAEQIPVTFKRR